MLKFNSLSLFILWIFIMMSKVSFAQNQQDNCDVYESVLNYYNKIENSIRYSFEGKVNPITGEEKGKRVKLSGIRQLYFYITKKKAEFNSDMVNYWFSEMMKDSFAAHDPYSVDIDSIFSCTFNKRIMYYCDDFYNIDLPEDGTIRIENSDTFYYFPMRITFSKIYYISNRMALVYALTYRGVGRGGDQWCDGFILKQINGKWIISKVERQIR